jgi:D-alanyl-D-alanine carboxypeptidase
VAAAVALLVALPPVARAQIGSDRYSSIVVDVASGNVLEQANPDAQRYPASLTKLMTLYMVFEALRDRRAALDDLVPVSAHAASM